jgi:hypothetical protein
METVQRFSAHLLQSAVCCGKGTLRIEMLATREEAAQSLAAFVKAQGGSIFTADIQLFYAQHPNQFSHIFTGRKGFVQAFVQEWPQYVTLEDAPGGNNIKLIRAVKHGGPPRTSRAPVLAPHTLNNIVPQDSAVDEPCSFTSGPVTPVPVSCTSPQQQPAHIDEEMQSLLDVLHPDLRVGFSPVEGEKLCVLTVDIGRCVAAYTGQPKQRAALSRRIVTQEHLDYTLERIGPNAFNSDDCAGLSRTLHRISALRNRHGSIIALTMRVGRALKGIANMIADILKTNQNILVLGESGSGKYHLHHVSEVHGFITIECSLNQYCVCALFDFTRRQDNFA